MRIAILEDDPGICRMLQEMLETVGHEVSTYDNGLDILAALITEDAEGPHFDVLLVDLFVPGEIAGIQVIHQVRTLRPDLHVVVISAASSQDLQTVPLRYPGVAVLQKPFKLRDLLSAVQVAQKFPQN